MPDEATILHADLDAFFASVEQRDDPALRGKPVAVGGGVVLAASYEARRFGVRSAMGGRQARRLCPDLVVVRSRFSAYSEASKAVFAVFEDTTPLVEGLSIDEAFLDVRGMRRLAGSPLAMALRLRDAVRERTGLPITIGIARTKFLAKVASGVAKPDGLLLLPPSAELAFLHLLPVERLWGVGPVTAGKLRAEGLDTVRDVARHSEEALVALLGRGAGRHLHALAHGRDPRRVQRGRRRRSMGAQRAIGRGRHTHAEMDATIVALVDRLGRRMRAAGRQCRTVMLRMRFADFTRASRARTLPRPTQATATLLGAARVLLGRSRSLLEARGCTLLGVTFTNLEERGGGQMALPVDPRPAIDAALDNVRDRFGTAAITRGVLVGRTPDTVMPVLPD